MGINRELTMQIFGALHIQKFTEEHADSRLPLDSWQLEAEVAQWSGPKEVKERYKSAVLSPNRIIFSLTRGLYKLAVKTKYEKGILLIERVWTDPKAHKIVPTIH